MNKASFILRNIEKISGLNLSMEILTITTTYPSAIDPNSGISIKNCFLAMDKFDDFKQKIIVPVPHCPKLRKFTSRYEKYEALADMKIHDGKEIYYPRYFTLPSFGLYDDASSMAKAIEENIATIYSEGSSFDLIDGQSLYPDGIAAYKIAKAHNKPLILTARSGDYDWLENNKAKKQIIEAINYASKIICTCEDLKNLLASLGVPEDKLTVITCGIDSDIFNIDVMANPLREKYYLSVASLTPPKGHHITLNAFADRLKERLIIVGVGEQRRELKAQAKDLRIHGRVQFIKHLDQKKLAEFYAGATATILMSSVEDTPSALLESLACGTPIIATDVGGVSEVVKEENGILLKGRSEYHLLNAMNALQGLNKSRKEISKTVSSFTWNDASSKLYGLYQDAISQS